MALFDWKDVYSVGVEDMDNQHKVLIDAINRLHDAMKSGKAKEMQKKILDELISYTNTHFTAEEKIMAQHSYPGLPEQKKQHQHFVVKLNGFQEDYKSGKLMLSLEMMKFLRDWLSNHILKIDKQYSLFFNQKGVS